MTPGSFDSVTAREMVGDQQARIIELKARQDADANNYAPPEYGPDGTYFYKVMKEMERVVYSEQFKKRTERNKRKALA
jgi:hypothetical protein